MNSVMSGAAWRRGAKSRELRRAVRGSKEGRVMGE
jgi:hypothetical protein